jgi:hypothetical protein
MVGDFEEWHMVMVEPSTMPNEDTKKTNKQRMNANQATTANNTNEQTHANEQGRSSRRVAPGGGTVHFGRLERGHEENKQTNARTPTKQRRQTTQTNKHTATARPIRRAPGPLEPAQARQVLQRN